MVSVRPLTSPPGTAVTEREVDAMFKSRPGKCESIRMKFNDLDASSRSTLGHYIVKHLCKEYGRTALGQLATVHTHRLETRNLPDGHAVDALRHYHAARI
jgi:hypothetical protein